MSDQNTPIHNLNIQLNNFQDIQNFNWNSNSPTFNFSVDFGRIKQISFLDGVVLYIQFENGEFRLDINQFELNKIQEKQKITR